MRRHRSESFDVVIVGAGSAGCALAARLSDDPTRSVLLVEAGDASTRYDALSNADSLEQAGFTSNHLEEDACWAYPSRLSSSCPRSLPVIRGRGVGGSSAVNGGVFLRALPEDFDSWGCPSWTWRKVLRTYVRVESDRDFGGEYHGADGPLPVERRAPASWASAYRAFAQAALDEGFPSKPDLNEPWGSGIGGVPRNSRDGLRVSSDHAHIGPVRSRRNLTIWTQARVAKVVIAYGRATGVEVVRDGDGRRVVAAAEVVLSAGALESPKLLALSGIGHPDRLRRAGIGVVHELPSVGENLRDHPAVVVRRAVKASRRHEAGRAVHQNLLTFTAPGSADRNDMQILPLHGAGAAHELRLACSLQLPASRGRLELDERDPHRPPTIVFEYLEDERDRRRLDEGAALCERLLGHEAFDDLLEVNGGAAERSRRWLEDNLISFFHTSGTCKMGADDDPTAVTDDQCRVRGIDGLRVVDLSIVPSNLRAPTNATAVMLGEHAACFFA
jgi:choline dehydrogenase